MKSRPDLLRRQAAIDKTVKKYRGRPFDWSTRDCVSMLRSHLVAMGHRKVPKLPKYSDARGALRALRDAGFEDVPALLDSLLPRIAPATALPGDIIVVQGSDSLDAVHISLGFKAFGWHEDSEGAAVLIDREIKGAWRA
jgi:hypothetical protein